MISILFRKIYLFLTPILLMYVSVFSKEINPSVFSSFEELITYETSQIADRFSSSYKDLAEAYMNRGDSYLVRGHYELALEDFQRGYDLAGFCSCDLKPILLLRSLFGFAFSYALMDEMDDFHFVENEIKMIFDSFDCRRLERSQSPNRTAFHSGYASISKNSEKPILGPDRISISECVERAESVAGASRILISCSRIDAQTFLNILIKDLEDRAVQCCYSGGIWKACLRPIVNKWQEWNEKWKVFGIPPNPAWD